MPDPLLVFDKERKIKSLKRRLEGWREILVGLYSVLIWSQPWYPALIVGLITFVFVIYWYTNPPFLTAFSLLTITVHFFELTIPRISFALYSPQQWTASKEKSYELVCESVVKFQLTAVRAYSYLKDLKTSQPMAYTLGMSFVCLFTAWLGYAVSIYSILYMIVLTMCLYPGIKQHNLVEKGLSSFITKVLNRFRGASQQEKLKTS